MKAKEFIEKHKIGSALAAGFISSLRRDPDADLPEADLEKSYKEFAGVSHDGKTVQPQTKTSASGNPVTEPVEALPVVEETEQTDQKKGLFKDKNK